MCGEKGVILELRRAIEGSPPHVRGKGVSAAACAVSCRITPACAGKRYARTGSAFTSRDHPRMCGEKSTVNVKPCGKTGSPPHVRGKGDVQAKVKALDRITPACAGKSLFAARRGFSNWDHPRMCGEKCQKSSSGFQVQGSPPHVRGKGLGFPVLFRLLGITPACAGKSFLLRLFCLLCLGSPPHVRGKGQSALRSGKQTRITPACAGKRPSSPYHSRRTWDHPRMCGEKLRKKTSDATE